MNSWTQAWLTSRQCVPPQGNARSASCSTTVSPVVLHRTVPYQVPRPAPHAAQPKPPTKPMQTSTLARTSGRKLPVHRVHSAAVALMRSDQPTTCLLNPSSNHRYITQTAIGFPLQRPPSGAPPHRLQTRACRPLPHINTPSRLPACHPHRPPPKRAVPKRPPHPPLHPALHPIAPPSAPPHSTWQVHMRAADQPLPPAWVRRPSPGSHVSACPRLRGCRCPDHNHNLEVPWDTSQGTSRNRYTAGTLPTASLPLSAGGACSVPRRRGTPLVARHQESRPRCTAPQPPTTPSPQDYK